jgi:hypothetical protein
MADLRATSRNGSWVVSTWPGVFNSTWTDAFWSLTCQNSVICRQNSAVVRRIWYFASDVVDLQPPLCSSIRVSGYRSRGPGFDSRALQGKNVVGLERGPFSLVTTTEEVLGRDSSGSGLDSREYCHRDSSRWPRGTLCPQKVGTNFADKRRSLGRYSSFADWGHWVLYIYIYNSYSGGTR